MADDDVFTVNELAAYLRSSADVVQALVRDQRIPHIKLGPRKTIFYRPVIDEWLRSESGVPTPPRLGLVADN